MSSLKVQTAELLSNVVTTYDQTKTTTLGSTAIQAILSSAAISPPSNQWLDVFSDSAETPTDMEYTTNNRVFTISAIVGGLARVMCYNLNKDTGVHTYVGKIQLTFPNQAATVHTIRGFKVDDSNTSNIKIFVRATGNVLINSGQFMGWGVALADFTPVLSVTLGFGFGSGQKAMYFLQDPSFIDSAHLDTLAVGLVIDRANSILYGHSGTAANPQFYLYDYSITPNVAGTVVTTPIATPGVVNWTAHGFVAGDHVMFQVSGGALPTGLIAGTVYFVIAAGLTANSFEVSLTLAGAAINFTGTSTGTQTGYRGFGITGSCWKWKTTNTLPALSGVLLANNSEKAATPAYSANSGFLCAFFATTTNLYLGKLSELTSGATTWPSLITSNLLGSANQVVAPVAVNADYDDQADRALISTSTTKIIAKKVINNLIEDIFGVLNNDFLEGVSGVGSTSFTQFGAITINDLKAKNGWNLISCGSVGQRGIIAKNSGADTSYDTSMCITKVLTLEGSSTLIGVALSALESNVSAQAAIFYRTSGFGSSSGGWVQLPQSLLFPTNFALTSPYQIQFKIESVMDDPFLSNPEFIQELYLAYAPFATISSNWEGSVDNTTNSGNSPMYVAFRMTQTYSSGTVPKLFVRGLDDSGNIIYTFDTVTNASLFSYSTNNGTSWAALGTIPNVALTTEVRVNITAPSGTRLTFGINES